MSGSAKRQYLIDSRGIFKKENRFITSCAISRDDSQIVFTTSEGDVWLVPRASMMDMQSWQQLAVHDGSILSLAHDALPSSFLTGGDDNSLRRIYPDGRIEVLSEGRKWVENVTSWSDGKNSLLAFSAGKDIELRDAEGKETLKILTHSSTVTGLIFDNKGKRLGASHYNGASLWFVNAKEATPRLLEWKGSHIGITIHPQGEALVTSMQENELHGWRLADGHNMRMSGYPQKVHSMSFSRNGKWLATSGADSVVMWPFFGGGPIGKPPVELAGIPGVMCQTVAFHPQFDMVGAGFANGAVFLADVSSQKMLPISDASHKLGSVSCLCFSSDGGLMAFGTEEGAMALLDLTART